MKHALYDREDGLAHCRVCGGAEGTLPKDCPDRRMTESEQNAVHNGELDFVDGEWIGEYLLQKSAVPLDIITILAARIPQTDAMIEQIAKACLSREAKLCDALINYYESEQMCHKLAVELAHEEFQQEG